MNNDLNARHRDTIGMRNVVAMVFVRKAVSGSGGSIARLGKSPPTETRLGQISPPKLSVAGGERNCPCANGFCHLTVTAKPAL